MLHRVTHLAQGYLGACLWQQIQLPMLGACRMVGSADRFAAADAEAEVPGNLARGRRPAHGLNGVASFITGTSLQDLVQSAHLPQDQQSTPGETLEGASDLKHWALSAVKLSAGIRCDSALPLPETRWMHRTILSGPGPKQAAALSVLSLQAMNM